MNRKWIAFALCICVLAGMLGGCSAEGDEPVVGATVTAVDGTAGVRENEDFSCLFDCDMGTKWCVTGFEGAYVIWSLSAEVRPTGYTIITANDNSSYTERNPASWALYGATGRKAPDRNSGKWELIDYIASDEKLRDQNFTPFEYEIYSLKEKYQHFMLVIPKTQGSSVMQISEFALQYEGADYTFTNSRATDGGTDGITDLVGSTYVSNGGEYTIGVGEALTFYYSRTPISSYYAYWWNIVDGDGDCLDYNYDGPTCQIIGVEPGTVTMTATMQCSVTSVVGGGYTYDYVYTFTVHVVEGSTGDHGDVTDGLCPRCHGAKKVACMACFGDGQLEGGRSCSCDGGFVPCPNCGNSGFWFKP